MTLQTTNGRASDEYKLYKPLNVWLATMLHKVLRIRLHAIFSIFFETMTGIVTSNTKDVTVKIVKLQIKKQELKLYWNSKTFILLNRIGFACNCSYMQREQCMRINRTGLNCVPWNSSGIRCQMKETVRSALNCFQILHYYDGNNIFL